jgi:hypothetical protein
LWPAPDKNPGERVSDGEPACRRDSAMCAQGVTPSAIERRDLHVRDSASHRSRELRAILSHD